jgi:hypothetical protein
MSVFLAPKLPTQLPCSISSKSEIPTSGDPPRNSRRKTQLASPSSLGCLGDFAKSLQGPPGQVGQVIGDLDALG